MLRYKLAPGTQVREEDFGLLFYQKQGPRLYFLSSGKYLQGEFFTGHKTLADLPLSQDDFPESIKIVTAQIENALSELAENGIILVC